MQALQKKDKKLIKASNNTCNGSINIDVCLQKLCPQDNRWDYGLDVDSKGIFIEVHPAYTSEIHTVLAKLSWLKSWVRAHCSGFQNLSKSFYWVATGTVAIRKGSPQAKRLAKAGIHGPSRYVNLG